MDQNRMIAAANLKRIGVRPNFLLVFGGQLGAHAVLVLAIYYLVSAISVQDARNLLSWMVPLSQSGCLVAAVLLSFGLAVRNAGAELDDGGGSSSPRLGLPNLGSLGRDGMRRNRISQGVADEAIPAKDAAGAIILLKQLDWNVFKRLGVDYFREIGFRVVDQLDRSNGVDFFLHLEGDYNAIAVRCLPWGTESVTLKQVRTIHRAMLLAGATEGVLLTTGKFDEEARAFGEDRKLELLDGERFAKRLLSLPSDVSCELLGEAANAGSLRQRSLQMA